MSNVTEQPQVDVLIVGLGSTAGLREVDNQLSAGLARHGLRVETVYPKTPRPVRTLALTDLGWALAARKAAVAGIKRFAPKRIIYSTTTAALLWPQPGIIRFDALAAGNRPGRHGIWQRQLERRRLRQAPLLLPQHAAALSELAKPLKTGPVVVLAVPVTSSGPIDQPRDITAITYAANPHKKGLDLILSAWQRAHKPGEQLLVTGVESGPEIDGVSYLAMVDYDDYRALLRRAKLFIAAARREDYGIVQLEALADGCMLVTTGSPGPYAALPIAQELDSRLVGNDLAAAIRAGIDHPVENYQAAAKALLEPYSQAAADRVINTQIFSYLA